MAHSKLSYSEVNSAPFRFFKKNPKVSSTGRPNTKFVFYDFSGSMTAHSKEQFLYFCKHYPDALIMPFGLSSWPGSRFHKADMRWREWLEFKSGEWIKAHELWRTWDDKKRVIDKWGDGAHQVYERDETFFPWGTYTTAIEKGLSLLPKSGSMIDLVFVGDGSFSDGNKFISIMSEAGAAGFLKKVENFSFLLAHNASQATRDKLTPLIQTTLTASNSKINYIPDILHMHPGHLCDVIKTVKSSGVDVPDGWLFFDCGRGPQIFHSNLTPASISEILKANGGLVSDYIDYLVRIFRDTPVVFTSENNIASKIFQALKTLKHYNSDMFGIQRSLFDRFSRANTTPLHNKAFKMLRTADTTAEKLFMEQMVSDFSGEFYQILNTEGGSPFSSTDLDDALRDMSFTTFIKLLDNSFSESSTDRLVKTSSGGFPVIRDCVDWNTKAIKSMRMIPFMLGQEGRLISGNFIMVAAMYILTSEEITEPYIRRVAETFIFSEENKSKLKSLIYKDGGSEFQDNIYSSSFARVIYHFYQIYSDRLSDLEIDFSMIKDIYVAICNILVRKNYKTTIKIKALGYNFRVGDFVLIEPVSWETSGKPCPYVEMVNLAVITDPNPKERNFRKGAYRLRFLEGDSKDFTYVTAEFMSKIANAEDVTKEIRTAIRAFQRNMWLKWLHYPDRRDDSDDGKELNADGSIVTFEQNLHCIMRMLNPRHSLELMEREELEMELPVPKIIIELITGIPHFVKISKAVIESVRLGLNVDVNIRAICDSIPPSDKRLTDEFHTFNHMIDVSDLETIYADFSRRCSIKCAGHECACGCEAIIRPGVVYTDPGCGHHFLPKCLDTYEKSCIQDPMDIDFGKSLCAMGCPSCISPLIRFNDHTVIITANIADEIVNASASNIVGRCMSCCDYFVRGPRDCATAHTLPIQCTECLPKRFWTCPGRMVDGRPCSIMTEHGGGCRMMQCCPIRNGWDDPCDSNCKHILKIGEIVISIGCGHRYKMDDGLEQDDGTAVSDGSVFY